MRLVIVFAILIVLFIGGCTTNEKKENINDNRDTNIFFSKFDEINNPCAVYNGTTMDFITQISNIPSPTSNIRYVTQSNNIFEIKFGDGEYMILSNDTMPFRLRCDDGHSMLPTFDCDDKIILQEIEDVNKINIGDIILYEVIDNHVITKKKLHRVIAKQDNNFYTRGDNFDNSLKYINNNLDLSGELVKSEQIKWKVVGIIYK